MPDNVVQFIPRPNPNRDQRTLEQQAVEIMNVVVVDDTMPSEMGFPPWPCEPHYLAPEEDPA